MIEMLRIGSHRDNDLPVGLPQHMDAIAVEFLVLVDRAHRDIHGFLRCLLMRLCDGPNGRTDEMIPVGEGIRTRLEIF